MCDAGSVSKWMMIPLVVVALLLLKIPIIKLGKLLNNIYI
jgi:hypothetical protein